MTLRREDLKFYVNEIRDKSVAKETRIAACYDFAEALYTKKVYFCFQAGEFCIHVAAEEDVYQLLESLCSKIFLKAGNADLKKACAEVATSIGLILSKYDFDSFVEWTREVFLKIPSKVEEERVLIVQVLHQTLTRSFAPEVLKIEKLEHSLIVLLKSTTSSVVFSALQKSFLEIAESYPQSFGNVFQFYVEAIISWFSDGLRPNCDVECCMETFIALSAFWQTQKSIGLQLIKEHFKKFNESQEDTTPEFIENLSKVARLNQIISTIIPLLRLEPTFVKSLICEARKTMGVHTKQLMAYPPQSGISEYVASFYDFFLLITTLSDAKFVEDKEKLLSDCVIDIFVLNARLPFSEKLVTKTLVFLTKAVSCISSAEILEKVVNFSLCESEMFFGSSCNAFSMMRSDNVGLISTVLAVLLSPVSLTSLQASYGPLRKAILEKLEKLKAEKQSSAKTRLIEVQLLVCFASFEEIATTKNSLIVMMGIRPCLFDFLLSEAPLMESWLCHKHPAVYHILLHLFLTHVKSHDYYISQSSWFTPAASPGISQSSRSEFARRQLLAILRIFEFDATKMWSKTKELVLNWLTGLIDSANSFSMGQLKKAPEWMELRQTICRVVCNANWDMKRLLPLAARLFAFSSTVMGEKDMVDCMIEKIKFMSISSGKKVWSTFDKKLFLKSCLNAKEISVHETSQKRILSTTFSAEDFFLVTSFLLKSRLPVKKGNANELMSESVTIIRATCDNLEDGSLTDRGDKENLIQKWRWILGQTVNFCIVNKMKTPLGKPMLTFSQFSGELQRLAMRVVNSGKEKVEGDENKETNEREDTRSLTPAEDWLRVRLLIEFVELLEKMIYSVTINGSMWPLCSSVSLPARQFFTTNLNSCNEWLFRTYYPAMVVSYFNGYHAQVIRFGQNALLELEKKAGTAKGESKGNIPPYVSSTLLWMARSMAVLGCEQAVKGLSDWLFRVHGVANTATIEALYCFAAGRFEQSLAMLEEICRDQSLSDTNRLIVRETMVAILERIRLPQAYDYYESFMRSESSANEDLRCVKMLTTFASVAEETRCQENPWSLEQHLKAYESSLTQTIKRTEISDMREKLDEYAVCAILTDGGGRAHSQIAATHLIASCVIQKINRKESNFAEETLFERLKTSFLLNENKEDTNIGERLTIGRQLTHWMSHLSNNHVPSEVHFDMARLARKSDNRNLLCFHLSALKLNVSSPIMQLNVARQQLKLVEGDRNVSKEALSCEMNSLFFSLASTFMNDVHLKQSLGITDHESIEFSGIPMDGMNNRQITAEAITKSSEAMARACVQVAGCIIRQPFLQNFLSPENNTTLIRMELDRCSSFLGARSIVGSMLMLASHLHPRLAKAHVRLAQWAFEFADTNTLEERAISQQLLSDTPETRDALWNCLNCKTLAQLETDVGRIVGAAHASVLLAPDGYFINLWERAKDHRARFYAVAVNAYFSYINYCSSQYEDLGKKNEDTISATLRILGLLIGNGDVLLGVIEQGLRTTNIHIWKDILPQLFARLSHPSAEVRQTLVDLLSRICLAAPHAVVFQIVAGASNYALESDDVISPSDGRDDEKSLDSADGRTQMRDCCHKLEKYLEQQYPKLVHDVRQFVNELQRINMLNEEKWTLVLNTMEYEMDKRLVQIRAENEKTAAASHLELPVREEIIAKKTKLITSQIFEILDELYERTCVRAPETANEREFQEMYGERLKVAFIESKECRIFPEKAWAPFKQISSTLTQRSLKRGGQPLNISNISNVLANLSKSSVPMPGQDSIEFNEVVLIDSVSAHAVVLPTKTRPKKLSFVGSDGKNHVFLFKGREDLHLDERIMQLLRLCNRMLTSGNAKRSWPEYTAHNYAVIPLGPRSGLIQWVDGATPLFHIYRRWQFRQAAARQAAKKSTEVITTTVECERPSEIFQQKLRATFAANNVDRLTMSERSKVPEQILREVLESLIQETPRDLISREFWIRSGCATTWWHVTSRFARSCAVMSMIGAILGLGDRHLDNLLVNLTTGHLVHIDYNICFDKGRNLRVPETVPFRLTQNMTHALGPTQTEGVFRESCEHVLNRLRAGKEVFMTMLDTFVYDPLVDWTASDHITSNPISLALTLAVYGSEWRSSSVRSVAKEMFAIRLIELSKPWMDNCEEMRFALQRVSEALLRHSSSPSSEADCDRINQERVECGRQLFATISRHQSMMKDFRPLIRVLAGCDERFQEFLKVYKLYFSEPLLKGHSALDSQDIDIVTCLQHFSIVLAHVQMVYFSLLSLNETEVKKPMLAPPPGLENVWVSKKRQEENAHARNVVSKVKGRLDGRVDGVETTLSSQQQVIPSELRTIRYGEFQAELLINHATSVSLLCKMYEGWTAWV